jgi:hypothetical protein
MALDRDGDGFLDGDEARLGSDGADPVSVPPGDPLPLARVALGTTALSLRTRRAEPSHARVSFVARTGRRAGTGRIAPPPWHSALDPTHRGAVLHVYGAAFTADAVRVELPASGWRRLGRERRPKGYRFRARDAVGGSPIRTLLLAPGVMRVRGTVPYSLDEPAQGRVAVRLVPGLLPGGGWCAVAAARTRGPLGATAKTDRPGRFVGASSAPPAECPPLP